MFGPMFGPMFDPMFGPMFDRQSQPLHTRCPPRYQADLLATKAVSEDGTEFNLVQEVLREARSPPVGSGNAQCAATALKIIKLQAEAALKKMHDPKVALCDKLASQDGKNSYGKNAEAHRRTTGCSTTNDAVENKFALADWAMRLYRNISILNVSGMVQQRGAHDFDRPLYIVSDRRKRKRAEEEAPQVTTVSLASHTHTWVRLAATTGFGT